MIKNGNANKSTTYLLYILFGAVAVLLILRAFYGFDWSDETYYAALPYRFALGDRLFIDSWDIHQTSAMLLVPLYWAYLHINGSMDGILLFMRLLFVVFQLAASVYLYHVLTGFYPKAVSCLAALLYLVFIPFAISTFSYNTMGYSFALLSSVTLLHAMKKEQSRGLLCLAGVWLSLAAMAYPFLAVLYPVYAALLFILFRRRKEEGRQGWPAAAVLWFTGGCAAVAVVVGLFVLGTTGLSGVTENIRYLFMDPAHKSGGLVKTAVSFLRQYWSMTFLPGVQAAALIVCLAAAVKKGLRTPLLQCWVALAGAAAIAGGAVVTLFFSDQASTVKINQLLLNFGLWPLIFYLLQPARRSLNSLLLLWLPANVLCACIYFASNTRMNGAPYALILSAMAAVLLFHDVVADARKTAEQGAGGQQRAGLEKVTRRVGLAAAAALAAGMLVLRFASVYRDAALPELNTRLATGPAKGLYTTEQKARDYEGIVADIRGSAPEKGEVLFTRLLPFGYLCTTLKPYPPSLWRTPLTDGRLNIMMDLHPDGRPSYLYIIKDQYGYYPQEDPIEGALVDYFKANGAKMSESGYAVKFVLDR